MEPTTVGIEYRVATRRATESLQVEMTLIRLSEPEAQAKRFSGIILRLRFKLYGQFIDCCRRLLVKQQIDRFFQPAAIPMVFPLWTVAVLVADVKFLQQLVHLLMMFTETAVAG